MRSTSPGAHGKRAPRPTKDPSRREPAAPSRTEPRRDKPTVPSGQGRADGRSEPSRDEASRADNSTQHRLPAKPGADIRVNAAVIHGPN
jgi:hypothetical protein